MVIGDFSKNVNIKINIQLLIFYCIKLSQKKKMFINIIPPTIAGKSGDNCAKYKLLYIIK